MATASKLKRAIQPYTMGGRFGILNHMGQLWSCETFDTADLAQKYIGNYQSQNKDCDLSRHTVIPVSVTVTAEQ